MPERIAVAYVRTIEPEAPPPPPRAVAPPAPRPAAAPGAATGRGRRVGGRSGGIGGRGARFVGRGRRCSRRHRRPTQTRRSRAPTPAPARRRSVAAAASASASAPPTGKVASADPTASGAASGDAFEWPASTRISYVLVGNYRGEVSGSAQVEWIRIADRYQANVDLVVGPDFSPLITRRMTSAGRIAPSGLVPERYDEDTHVVFRDRRRNSVVFESDAVILANGERRDPVAGVQDTASQFIQLTYLFSTRPELLEVGGAVGFPLALPRAVDTYVYDVVETETVRLPVRPAARIPPEAAAAAEPPARLAQRRVLDRARAALPAGAHPHRAGSADLHRRDDRQEARDGQRRDGHLLRAGEKDAMTYECILTDVRGTGPRRAGVITLNRPKQFNALNDTLMDELGAALKAFDGDDTIGCIVVTGGDKAFAAGADIGVMQPYGFADAYTRGLISRNWETMRTIRKPVIAAVAGFALGGGCEVAMMCDIVIAADSAKFGQPEIKLGIIPGAGGTQRLPRAVGKAKAMDLVLTARMMDAAEAERAGLVSRVVPAADLLDVALAAAETICSYSGPSVMMAKDAVNRAFEMPLSDGIAYERHLFHSLFATDDKNEGMAAFLAKRKPDFKHR